MTIIARMRRLSRDTRGATIIEYGLIVTLIAIAIIVSLTQLRTSIANSFSTIANTLSNGR